MRVSLKQLMEYFGVGYELGPYETAPWSHYDADKETTCAAEVRMGSEGDEIEAEIQFLHDNPQAGQLAMMPICYIRAAEVGNDQWSVKNFLIRGKSYEGDLPSQWEQKCCLFFRAVVQDLIAEKIPDIDDLLDQEMQEDDTGGGGGGGGGGRRLKASNNDLMGMKKGGGGF